MSRKRAVAMALETVSPNALAGVYYIARDLETPRVTLRRGTLWEPQSKIHIRGYSQSYGIPDDGRPFHLLPFVTILVGPVELGNEITPWPASWCGRRPERRRGGSDHSARMSRSR